MADINTLLTNGARDGYFRKVARSPLTQFGTDAEPFLGATLLPEREVPQNAYREDAIKYRTVIANSGTRYSPAQKKGNQLVGSFMVELGESDIANEFTGREYDALLASLGSAQDMEAMTRLLRWQELTLNRPLSVLNEKQRWEAIVSAQVIRKGDNGYYEEVDYSNPSGHRVNASVTWSNDANDPYESDILPMADFLMGKGFKINRIITARPVITILANNAKMQARMGLPVVNVAGTIAVARARASKDAISEMFSRDDLPPIETYDRQYRTQTGTGYYLPRNVFVMVCTTGQDESVDLGDDERLLENTLGYVGVGTPAGQSQPGRAVYMQAFEDKPPRVHGEEWQTALPVITEPEAVGVIGAIS